MAGGSFELRSLEPLWAARRYHLFKSSKKHKREAEVGTWMLLDISPVMLTLERCKERFLFVLNFNITCQNFILLIGLLGESD